MDTGLDALATALYVEVDDFVITHPELVPWRPKIGIKPQVSDAELITLGVLAVILQVDNETRWVRQVHARFTHLFPYLPQARRHRGEAAVLGAAAWAPCEAPHPATTKGRFFDLECESGRDGYLVIEQLRTRDTRRLSPTANGPSKTSPERSTPHWRSDMASDLWSGPEPGARPTKSQRQTIRGGRRGAIL